MLKIKVKDVVIIIVLITIVIGLLYINGLVFIQGGVTKNNELLEKIESDIEFMVKKDIEFMNSLALNEVYYVFKTDSELLYVNNESALVESFDLNKYDEGYWNNLANSNGLNSTIIKHGYYGEAVISLADDVCEMIYSLESKELLFKHER